MSMAPEPFLGVQPGAAGSIDTDVPPAPFPRVQDLAQLVPDPHKAQPLKLTWSLSALAAGAVLTVTTDAGVPEYWHVEVRSVANTNVRVWQGPQSSGVPDAILGGGGYAKISGRSDFLTVQNAGAGAIDGVIVATRHFDYTVSAGAV